MSALIIAAAVGIGVALASGAGPRGDVVSDDTDWDPPKQGGLEYLKALALRGGLSEDWAAFLAFVARGESRWNNLVGLGDPDLFPPGTRPNLNASKSLQDAEARAARIAWNRNGVERGWFDGCGNDPIDYQFGSGGWFGMIPANGLGVLRNTELRCLPPAAVFDPAASLVMALAMARGLMSWSGYKKDPSVLNLRLMWGCPSCGGSQTKMAEKRSKFAEHARDTGLPSSFLDRELRRPTISLEDFYRNMLGPESAAPTTPDDAYDITTDNAFALMRPEGFYQ